MFNGIENFDISGCECCFCKKSIQETRTDPIDMNLVFNEDMMQKTGASQSFYTHFDCLHERLHKDVRGYFVKLND